MIFLLFVAFAMIMWITVFYLHFLPVPKPTYYQFLTLTLITIVQPLMIYRTIKRTYDSSSQLKETLDIELTTTEIKIHGESFYTELSWAKTHKVVELKNWFMIYQNILSAILIPKKSFKLGQAEEFKKLLKSITDLRIHLLKNS